MSSARLRTSVTVAVEPHADARARRDARAREHAERDALTAGLLDRAIAQPDPGVAEELRREAVLVNRSLAVGLAHQYERRGVDRDDLEQIALLALVGAVQRYRLGRGSGFAAFAVPSILGELRRHFRDHGWAVRPPRSLQELHRDVLRADVEIEQVLERPPTDAEVATRLSVPVVDVRRARVVETQYRASSLDAPLGPNAASSLLEVLPYDVDDDPYDKVVSLLALKSALARLDGTDLELLELRFGRELTQRQIGRRIGVSQMQVSRLLTALLLRLRADIEDDRSPAVPGADTPPAAVPQHERLAG